MKKNLLFALFIGISTLAVAQSKKTRKTGADMINRNSDHISIQIGKLTWGGKPDSIDTRGLSRTLNIHFFKDFIFKTDNRFSVAIGVGVGSDHFLFKNKTINLNRTSSTALLFPTQVGTIYTRTKLAATYFEAPVELRFALNPTNYDNSFKIALGVKVGQLLDVHTKRKKAETNGNAVVLPTLKEKDRNYFNKTRLAATARVGYGHFSLFGTYQVNSFIKDEFNFNIKPFTIGICLSGM